MDVGEKVITWARTERGGRSVLRTRTAGAQLGAQIWQRNQSTSTSMKPTTHRGIILLPLNNLDTIKVLYYLFSAKRFSSLFTVVRCQTDGRGIMYKSNQLEFYGRDEICMINYIQMN